MTPLLQINNLQASVEGHEVLTGVTLDIPAGSFHMLMGPNGSGKSSFALTLLGHPAYHVTGGSVTLDGQSLLALKPHERARLGIALSFQNPVALPGVSVANLTRTAYKQLYGEKHADVRVFRKRITGLLSELHLDPSFLDRSVNDGFSGGEKKLSEILQLAVLGPKMIILDEPDSGLDIDALKRIASVIKELRTHERSFLLITHNPRLADLLSPDVVHLFLGGKVVRSGGKDLVTLLERTGYESFEGAHA